MTLVVSLCGPVTPVWSIAVHVVHIQISRPAIDSSDLAGQTVPLGPLYNQPATESTYSVLTHALDIKRGADASRPGRIRFGRCRTSVLLTQRVWTQSFLPAADCPTATANFHFHFLFLFFSSSSSLLHHRHLLFISFVSLNFKSVSGFSILLSWYPTVCCSPIAPPPVYHSFFLSSTAPRSLLPTACLKLNLFVPFALRVSFPCSFTLGWRCCWKNSLHTPIFHFPSV